MRKLIKLTGQKFSRLLVLGRDENAKNGNSRWNCLCDCGNAVIVRGDYLTSGHTKSCGCYKFETRNATHGKSKSPTYSVWCGMRQRCNSKNHIHYSSYGGRGITVCSRWSKFENFHKDMGEKPEGLTLDRINNDLGYSPDNCRWATAKDQARNTRKNKNLTVNGKTRCLQAWAEEYNVPCNTVINRLNRGIDIVTALTVKYKKQNRQSGAM